MIDQVNNLRSKRKSLFLKEKQVLIWFLQGEKDDKIIAVCADDPEYRDINDIKDLPPHRLAEIRRFFEDCKFLAYNNCEHLQT